jgi:hypothetical protein
MHKFKTILFLVIGFILIMLITGCKDEILVEDDSLDVTPDDAIVCAMDVKECPDGSFVSRNPEKGCEFDSCPEDLQTSEKTETQSEISDEIREIQSKINNLNSYEYLDSTTKYIYLVKDDKVVLLTSNINEFEYPILINSIYIDFTEKTAYGACVPPIGSRYTFNCGKDLSKYIKLDFNQFSEKPNPFKELQELSNAEHKGTINCDSRVCDIIDYTKDNVNYRMLVRRPFVLPYKIQRLDSERKVVSEITYSNAAFNHLSNSDMVIPSNFNLVE